MEFRLEDVDVHVTDQRIGMGIGGFDYRMRFYHKPTETLLEFKSQGSKWKAREKGLTILQMLVEEEP